MDSNPSSPSGLVGEVSDHLDPSRYHDRFAHIGRCPRTGKDLTLCYNTFGDASHPCVLLVQGLGTSLLGYSLAFIEHLVRAGFFVVRYDNRDVGRSTTFEEFASPSLARYALPAWASVGERVPYTLMEMMEDGMALLTAVGVEKAHVVGMSMGGMIVQLMAIHHPERVLSLNIIFSHMGGRDAVEPGYMTYLRFLKQPKSKSQEDLIEHMLWYIKFLSQGQHDGTEEELREYFRRSFERNGYTDFNGQGRQIAALMRQTSRRTALQHLRCPTVVLHGALDPLIPVENGYRLAATIPHAKLVVYPTLGHDFPPSLYSDMTAEIILNARRTGAESSVRATCSA